MERPLSPRPASTDGSAFRPVGESQHSPFVPPPGGVHSHHGRKGSDGTESAPPLRSQIRSFLQSPAVRDMSVGRNALALQQLRPIGIKRASTGKKPTTKKRRVRESESDVGECEDDDDVASSTDEKEKKEEGKQVSERVEELEDQVRKLQMEVLEARQKAKMEEDTMRAVFQKRKEALNKKYEELKETTDSQHQADKRAIILLKESKLDLERRVRTLERRQDMGVTQLREELVKAEEENGKLKRDIKVLEDNQQLYEKELAQYRNRVVSLTTSELRSENEVETPSKRTHAPPTFTVTPEKRNKELAQELDRIRRELHHVRGVKQEAEERRENLERLKVDLEEEKQRVKELDRQCAQLRSENVELISMRDERDRWTKLVGELQEFQSPAKLAEYIGKLRADHVIAEEQKESAKLEVLVRDRQIESLEQELSEARSSLRTLEVIKREMAVEAEVARCEHDRLLKECQSNKRLADSYRQSEKTAIDHISVKMNDEMTSLRDRIKALEVDYEAAMQKLEEYEHRESMGAFNPGNTKVNPLCTAIPSARSDQAEKEQLLEEIELLKAQIEAAGSSSATPCRGDAETIERLRSEIKRMSRIKQKSKYPNKIAKDKFQDFRAISSEVFGWRLDFVPGHKHQYRFTCQYATDKTRYLDFEVENGAVQILETRYAEEIAPDVKCVTGEMDGEAWIPRLMMLLCQRNLDRLRSAEPSNVQ